MALRRLVFPLQRREELTREDFQRYWREQHAPLVRSHAQTLGIQRYVQVHTDLNAETDPGRVARDGQPPHDGVAELWIDRDLATGTIEEQRAAGAELLADEATFIDLAASNLCYYCFIFSIRIHPWFPESYLNLRITPITTPWMLKSPSWTMIGSISGLAGCRRTWPFSR